MIKMVANLKNLLSWPNSHYYQRLCQTSGQGLAVVTDGLASDAALERTAWTLDMMMQVFALISMDFCQIGAGFRWPAVFADNGLLCGELYEGGRVQTGCDGALPHWNGRCWDNLLSQMMTLYHLWTSLFLWYRVSLSFDALNSHLIMINPIGF